MNSTLEDSVFSFDLDFLHPTTNNIPVQVLKQRYIGQIKKRIIRVDALNNHCNSLKLEVFNKNKEIELLKVKLETTTKEYTQTSLEYKEVLENFSKSDEECNNLKKAIKDCQERFLEAENRVLAGKSHIVQLQQLVKEHERKIETLEKNDKKKLEKVSKEKVEKELVVLKKKYNKEIAEWQVKYDTLLKKLEDTTLQNDKYKKGKSNKNETDDSDRLALDEHNDNEDDMSSGYLSPLSIKDSAQYNGDVNGRCSIPNHTSSDNESKTEDVSVDTGCGSSVASPNTISEDVFPIDVQKSQPVVDKVILIDNQVLQTVAIDNQVLQTVAIDNQVLQTVAIDNQVLQTVAIDNQVLQTVAIDNQVLQTVAIDNQVLQTVAEEEILITVEEPQAKGCLELNKSNNLEIDSSTDHEIETIFNAMRWDCSLITPIPTTPQKINTPSTKSRQSEAQTDTIIHCACPDAANANAVAVEAREEAATARKDLAITKEEQKSIKANLANLTKDFLYFKNLIKTKFIKGNKDSKKLDVSPKNLFKNNCLNNEDVSCGNLFNSVSKSHSSESEADFVLSQKNTPEYQSSDLSEPVIIYYCLENSCDEKASSPLPVEEVEHMENIAEHVESMAEHVENNRQLGQVSPYHDTNANLNFTSLFQSISNSQDSKSEAELASSDSQSRILLDSTPMENNNNENEIIFEPDEDAEQIEKITEQEYVAPLQNLFEKESTVNLKFRPLFNPVCNSPTSEIDIVLPPTTSDFQLPDFTKTTSYVESNNNEESTSIKPVSEVEQVENKLSTKDSEMRTVKRSKKLTRLSKYRNRCEVRNRKIKRETPPLKKPRKTPKQLPQQIVIKVTRSDTAATLNDKQVYANAVKVMAELNAKKNKKSEDSLAKTPVKKVTPAKHSEEAESTISIPKDKPGKQNVHTEISSQESILLLDIRSRRPSVVITPLSSPISNKFSPIRETTTTPPRRRSSRTSKQNIYSSSYEKESSKVSHVMQSPKTLFKSPMRAHRSPSPTLSSPRTPRHSVRRSIFPKASPKVAQSSSETDSASIKPLISLESKTISQDPCAQSFPARIASACLKSQKSSEQDASFKPLISSESGTILGGLFTPSPVATIPAVKPDKTNTAYMSKSCTENKESSINRPTEKTARKRKLSNNSDILHKRVLRSNSIQESSTDENTNADQIAIEKLSNVVALCKTSCNPKESIMCAMIQKYGKAKNRQTFRHVSDAVLTMISDKIESFISTIREGNKNDAMNEFVEALKILNYKNFVSGLIKYLTNPERKLELFAKVTAPPAPQMTKSEAVLLYVIRRLREHWRPVDIVHTILASLEHTLFKLNRTPDFDVIDSVSHFYALVCRYFGLESRLKMFMLDAMYCILYKAAPLIKQCLDVWPLIIPLAHMREAKIPLVTILVYLLHFYKCDDRHNKVQEIRLMLNRKYSYQLTEWNERRILELVSNSISELRDNPVEKKMLRIAIIILGKRHGPRWTQNNIIKKLFQYVEKENTPEHIIAFCIALIGPLMKPFPSDMKVHCEIAINQLMGVLNSTKSKRIEEAAMTSIILMGRYDPQRINEMLLTRKMGAMSPELEGLLHALIRTKPLHIWLRTLSRPIGPVEI